MKKYTDKQNENILKEPATVYSKTPKAKNAVAPEGYMTGEEFENNLINRITKLYSENGLLH